MTYVILTVSLPLLLFFKLLLSFYSARIVLNEETMLEKRYGGWKCAEA